jgi:hypothetical protein
MARSLLDQLTQIRRSGTYDDLVDSVNLSSVAEPVISGSLEHDLNNVRTIQKQIKGTSNWFDTLGNYFDPTSASGGASTKPLNLTNIGGHTLDAKTIILAVSDCNAAAGYTVNAASTGVLLPLTTQYATDVDRTGLPIFASTANAGDYFDEGGFDNVCRIDVTNKANDGEFATPGGHTVYAKFHDGADFAGTGTLTDVYARFYANGAEITLSGTGVTEVCFVYPYRRRLTDMAEYEWLRTDFISSWEGDIELIEDISNLWSFTGATDGDTTPQPWTNTTNYYIFASDPSNLQTAVDILNTGIGDRDYLEENYVTNGESIADSIDKLDQAIADFTGVEKYIEELSVPTIKNTLHALPYGITYTPFSTAGREGKNMDVYVDGQLLAADTGAAGANADRDYGETTASGITFRFNIPQGRNVTYFVRA